MPISTQVVAWVASWWSRASPYHAWTPSDVTPIIADKPSANREFSPRPYLFTGFRRLPFLGWSIPNDAFVPLVDTPPAQPLRPFLFKEYLRQPQLGWAAPHTQDDTLTTPGPSSVPRPYLFREYPRQPWLGILNAPSEQDTSLQQPGPSWQATRQWAKWQPQPQLGWAIPADVFVLPPDTPPAPTLSPYLFGREQYRRQAWLGRTVADVPPAPTPGDSVALLVVAYYERWSGRIAGLHYPLATDLPPVDIQPDPGANVVLRPYLFKGYAPQPWLGWAARSEQDANLSTPAVQWTAIRAWARWTPQPKLGWGVPAQQDTALTSGQSWTPVRAWGKWAPQPQLGWTAPATQDSSLTLPGPASVARPYLFREYPRQAWQGVSSTPSGQDTALSQPGPAWRPIQPWQTWKRQPVLGWTAPADQDAAAKTPDPIWTPGKPWPKWLAQPTLGWAAAGDQPAAPPDATPTAHWTPTRPWTRWQPQPALGWTPAPPVGVVQIVTEGPAWQRPVVWVVRWRPQPQLGWASPADPDPGLSAPGPGWFAIKPWRPWQPQPGAGWTVPGDQDLEGRAAVAIWTPTRPWQRWEIAPAVRVVRWHGAVDVAPAGTPRLTLIAPARTYTLTAQARVYTLTAQARVYTLTAPARTYTLTAEHRRVPLV